MTAGAATPCRRAEAALLAGGIPVPLEVGAHAAACETCGSWQVMQFALCGATVIVSSAIFISSASVKSATSLPWS